MGALVTLLGPGPTAAKGVWAEQDEGAASVGAYETVAGRRDSPALRFQGWVFGARHGREGLREEAVHTSPHLEGKGAEELQGEPLCLGKGPQEPAELPAPPPLFSAVDTLPAWGSSGDLSVSGQLLCFP